MQMGLARLATRSRHTGPEVFVVQWGRSRYACVLDQPAVSRLHSLIKALDSDHGSDAGSAGLGLGRPSRGEAGSLRRARNAHCGPMCGPGCAAAARCTQQARGAGPGFALGLLGLPVTPARPRRGGGRRGNGARSAGAAGEVGEGGRVLPPPPPPLAGRVTHARLTTNLALPLVAPPPAAAAVDEGAAGRHAGLPLRVPSRHRQRPPAAACLLPQAGALQQRGAADGRRAAAHRVRAGRPLGRGHRVGHGKRRFKIGCR